MASRRSFLQYVEQEFGKFPRFVLYAVLEWVLIILLFLDGFLAFLSNQYAKFFELKAPCLLCTRINHVLADRSPNVYFNESICELHKRDISSLAYCHVHRKLSEIKDMCEGCLLSFATEREFDMAHNEEDEMVNARRAKMERLAIDGVPRCCCCGELLKTRPSSYNRSYSSNRRLLQHVQSSPRASELPHIRFTELKFVSDIEMEIPEDDEGCRAAAKEDSKPASMQPESDYATEDVKTPTFSRGNRFFGIPLTDSPTTSPRFASRIPKKLQLNKSSSDLLVESNDNASESDGDSIINRLKRQIRMDRKTLMALYTELDEERSASAVAANNAMAMITRLQADKAAVQMEALQYQRLMEEQSEYDQEVLRAMREEFKAIEDELDAYRDKYGPLDRDGDGSDDECEVDGNDDFHDFSPPSSGRGKSGLNHLYQSSSDT